MLRMMHDGEKVLWKSKDGKSLMTEGYSRWHNIYHNGIHIGTSYTESNIADPEKWVKKNLKKRLSVIQRNVERLTIELDGWNKEREELIQ